MAITLGSNIPSLQAQSELGRSTSALSKSYQRLSSGLRINQASDDAAGLAIATQLNSKARVFNQAVRNVNDAISSASIAEGALSALKAISQRQLELAEEAANGTYSNKQRGALNTEANALVDEYNRIVGSTSFNGQNLFDPNNASLQIQAGYGKDGQLSLSLSGSLSRITGSGSFSDSTETDSNPGYTVAAADFNGDGILDYVGGAQYKGYVFLGNGDGTFRNSQSVATSFDWQNVVTSDFNGDGIQDFAAATDGDLVQVYLGNGNGTFKTPTQANGGDEPYALAVGDFNGDGKSDLIVAGTNHDQNVLLGTGDGTFVVGQNFSPVTRDNSVAVGDFNGDGKLDFAVGSYVDNAVTIHFGNGNGTFSDGITFASAGANSLAVGDLNGDGFDDIVVANGGQSYSTSIFIANSNGTFKAAKTIATDYASNSVALADLNGDGYLDLVNALATGGIGPEVSLGNGDGTFRISKDYEGNGSNALAIGDFNGDGAPDILSDSYAGGGLFYSAQGVRTETSQHLNLSSQHGAREALGIVNKNLDRIEAQLGSIGATTSRLNSVLGTLQAESQNFEAAASRIQDVDVASEAAIVTRKSILQQAAASVLAQANQQPALALKLLS